MKLSFVRHLGNLLSSGDVVLGYDLVASVIPGADEWSLKNSFNSSFVLPDVVLVKKVKNNDAEEAERKEAKAEKPKAGSSMSKRRERRKKKEEKKMRDLAAAASRMGFGEETETSEDPELEQS
jgi:hypothetical protein